MVTINNYFFFHTQGGGRGRNNEYFYFRCATSVSVYSVYTCIIEPENMYCSIREMRRSMNKKIENECI